MGVPKFFRYISERYPCLSEIVKEYQIPEFDNLYLDMNGIIHMCSHPDDGDPHFRISEEKILTDIFHYIEVLFRMIKPKKLFFMAVDGVAPRAKMNQQRARRFRSAKDAEKLEEKARSRGEVLPNETRFDSNCITPGTVFMAKLHEQLKYFVVSKISTDRLWQSCEVILSGHETPGEGEHKIMDYIRYMRSQPHYNPNTRHCLYGLDADLIMLGLCTHEPNFSLLREEVKFGKKSTKRKTSPEEITFYLLHLSLMREYLELEFDAIRKRGVLKFGFDIEKVIDDWVLMGFLVGNDFIPHLPNLHIANGALPVLYKTYMEVLPTFDGYINECGTLNLERFEKFMKSLANIDLENFEEQYTDLKFFEGKTGRKPDGKQRKSYKQKDADDVMEVEASAPTNKTVNSDLAALIESTEVMYSDTRRTENDSDIDLHPCSDNCSDDCNLRDNDMFKDEFEQHKQDYYRNKLEYSNVTSDVYKAQAEGYVRAIQWNLNYYYNGVCSWSWYYPHHYAPYTSDVVGFSDLKLEFESGKPFLPYEQLLAVLPAASRTLLPQSYHHLMTDDSSLIKEYYPEEFQTDLNGKRAEWEAVVLIPFIDEKVLLQAMEPCNEQLTEEERRRNTHGPMLIYSYTQENLGVYLAPEYFLPVQQNHASVISLTIDDIHVPNEKLVKGAYRCKRVDTYYLGFPTLKHLQFTHALEKASVKVHEHPSRGENMILKIIKKAISEEEPSLDAVARELLGSTIYVAWPHLVEALVVTVSDESFQYHSTGERGHYNVEDNKGKTAQTWQMEKNSITNYYMSRFGVDVGSTEVLVHVKVMVGRKYVFTSQCRANLEKQWAPITSPFPLQTIVKDISVNDGKYTLYKDVETIFPVGSTCFMLGHPHYGSMGEVKDSKESLKKGRIKVCMKAYEEPNFNYVRNYCEKARVRYMDLQAASARSALSKNLFSRITGTIFVTVNAKKKGGLDEANKANIGLNLKFTARNEEVPGYTQRKDGVWFYSEKAVSLVNEYNKFCPELFEYIQTNNENIYAVEELFPDQDGKEKLDQVTTWIKSQPFYSVEKRACGSSVLDPEVIAKLEEVIEQYSKTAPKNVMMQVRPHLLYKSELNIGNIAPDPTTTFCLYDRVVNIRESYTVPLGLRGTVIALHNSSASEKESEPMYDVLFDEAFTGGLMLNCSPARGYRLPKAALINKSHGRRQFEEKTGKPGQIIQRINTNVPQQGVNFLNNSMYAPPQQSSAFATWPNHMGQPLKPPCLQQNFNYNIPPRNAFSVSMGVQNLRLTGQNNLVSEGDKSDAQQYTLQQQFNFSKNNQQVRNTSSQNNKTAGVSPQRQHLSEAQAVKGLVRNKPTENFRQSRDNWRILPDKNERPKVNTDYLKRVLKINAAEPLRSTDQKTESSNTEKNTAKIGNLKLPSSPFSSVQLLSYYQSNGLGCPHYTYFDLPNKIIQAQLINPVDGKPVCGEPASNKLEASEHVAAELLKVLSKMHDNKSSSNLSPAVTSASIPAPPRTWCQPNRNQNFQVASKTINVKQENVVKDNNETRVLTKVPETKTTIIATQFVPLQAVRSHVSKRSSSNPEKRDVSFKENEDDSARSPFVNNISANISVPKVPDGEVVDVIQKPRRERKMRIAANFQVKLET